jgi:SAM-dependent methyltransferase
MVNKIIFLLKRYAWFKRFNAKVTYELLAKRIPAEDWHFMNYGYVPQPSEETLAVDEAVVKQKYSLQMYHYLALKSPLKGKHVLEVGSGRGGGAKYLSGFSSPASYTGMDLAKSAVKLANKIHQAPNLNFIQGSAESIPMEDNSIDVVINVESCHAYGCVKTFLSEVKRVLRPGGHLLLVDFRNTQENMVIFKQQLSMAGLELVKEEDITSNVIEAIEAEDEKKVARIKSLIAPRYQKLFCEFAGVVGSPFHLTLKNGTRHYGRFVLRKAA